MGFLITKQSKAELVAELKRNYSTITEWSLVGNHLWGLYPVTTTHGGKFAIGDLVIHLFLIKSFGDGGYGYKCLSESARPYYYTCPLKFLDKAVELSADWRNDVRTHHKTKAERASAMKRIKVGDTITLRNTTLKSVRVIALKPMLGIDETNNRTYRIPSKFIA
jgi:hypothetical protein